MHWIDWLLVAVPLVALCGLALFTRRYVRGVADFIAAGRCAGRYLLANAKGEAGSGVTNTISWFEAFMVAGFVTTFWSTLSVPLALIVGITGFAVYRYRETRCLTVAQFFEMRYSRAFRIFMGFLAFMAGVLNYGIFPAVSARFFIFFLGLPESIHLGSVGVPTFLAFMAVYLTISCALILFGGQVTLIVTDCVEGILSHLIYVVIIVALLTMISWRQIVEVLTGSPGGVAAIAPAHSPVNPFDAFATKNFNVWYVLLGMVGTVYGVMSWQGGHGFNSAARTPHEGRMGNVLGKWRDYARTLVLVVLVICTMTFLRHPDFAARSLEVKREVVQIPRPGEDKAPDAYAAHVEQLGSQKWFEDKDRSRVPQLQQQQITTVGLRHLLPTGIKGLFLLVMVLGLFAGDGNHLHSWSSILVQDLVMPLLNRPLTPRAHLILLRASVVGVACFAFVFSALFALDVDIWMWWAITGAIFNGGAGAVILGGLYWRRGTATGAWVSMVLGSGLSVSAILLDKYWLAIAPWANGHLGMHLPARMWLNPQWHGFIVMCIAAGSYVGVSILTSRAPFDMDWLLKRGRYRVASDHAGEAHARPSLWQRLIGIDSAFTRVDRFIASFIFWWSMFLVGLLLVMVGWHYGLGGFRPDLRLSNRGWTTYWLIFGLGIPFVFSTITLVWFSVGGVIDLKAFFHALGTMKRDAGDDGTVHENAPPARYTPPR